MSIVHLNAGEGLCGAVQADAINDKNSYLFIYIIYIYIFV